MYLCMFMCVHVYRYGYVYAYVYVYVSVSVSVSVYVYVYVYVLSWNRKALFNKSSLCCASSASIALLISRALSGKRPALQKASVLARFKEAKRFLASGRRSRKQRS